MGDFQDAGHGFPTQAAAVGKYMHHKGGTLRRIHVSQGVPGDICHCWKGRQGS
jgi:hypothetical protein